MRVTEQLLRENRKKENQKKRAPEEEEETMTYMPYPVRQEPLNKQPGRFTRQEVSFHNQESTFDRQALFDTRKEKN